MPQQERCGSVPTNGIAFARFCPVQRQLTWASNEGAAEDRLLRKGRGSGRPEKGSWISGPCCNTTTYFLQALVGHPHIHLTGNLHKKKTGFGS